MLVFKIKKYVVGMLTVFNSLLFSLEGVNTSSE